MLNKEPDAEVSDTTSDDSSTKAGKQKNTNERTFPTKEKRRLDTQTIPRAKGNGVSYGKEKTSCYCHEGNPGIM